MPYLLTCSHCGHETYYGVAQMLTALQRLGMLRRQREPDVDLIDELFRSSAARLPCGECGQLGSRFESATDDDDAWSETRACDNCGQPIDSARLEALPDTRRCTACQRSLDSGATPAAGADQFCPRCGDLLATRQSGSAGITRYIQHCSACGWKN